jgi:hypothetical protein
MRTFAQSRVLSARPVLPQALYPALICLFYLMVSMCFLCVCSLLSVLCLSLLPLFSVLLRPCLFGLFGAWFEIIDFTLALWSSHIQCSLCCSLASCYLDLSWEHPTLQAALTEAPNTSNLKHHSQLNVNSKWGTQHNTLHTSANQHPYNEQPHQAF